MGFSPNLYIGQVPSPDQWNEWLSRKADDFPYAKVIPTSGQSLVAAFGTGTLLLVPAAELSALIVTAPPNAADSQIFRITTTQPIDAVTVLPATAQSLFGGGPFAMSANGGVAWIFVRADLAWYRIQ